MDIFYNKDILTHVFKYLNFKEIGVLIKTAKKLDIKKILKVMINNIIDTNTYFILGTKYNPLTTPRLYSTDDMIRMTASYISIKMKSFFTKNIEIFDFYNFSELQSFFTKIKIKRDDVFQNKINNNQYYISLGYNEPLWKKINYRVGEKIDVLDNIGIWYEGVITELNDKYIKVHYRSWNKAFDQLFYFEETENENMIYHLAPAYTFVQKWRDQIKPNMLIEFLDPLTSLWYVGKVIKINQSCPVHTSCFHIKSSWNSLYLHRPQDDDIAPLGVHSGYTCYYETHFFLNKKISQSNGSILLYAELTFIKYRCKIRIIKKNF